MNLKKKRPYDGQRNIRLQMLGVMGEMAEHGINWLNRLSKASVVLIIVCVTIGLFIFFKWINAGQINLARSGDNIINMVILLSMSEFLSQLWEFNGEESMGWGSM